MNTTIALNNLRVQAPVLPRCFAVDSPIPYIPLGKDFIEHNIAFESEWYCLDGVEDSEHPSEMIASFYHTLCKDVKKAIGAVLAKNPGCQLMAEWAEDIYGACYFETNQDGHFRYRFEIQLKQEKP